MSGTGGNTSNLCPAPMTRSALIALRAAGSLRPECHYVITDPPSVGNMAVTRLVLHAAATDRLEVSVWARVSWDASGIEVGYDIDANTYTWARDRLDNYVTGTHAQIGQFPWGNASVTGNRCRNVSFPTFSGSIMRDNEISNSTLNLTGGSIERCGISTSSAITISAGGSTTTVADCVFSNGILLANNSGMSITATRISAATLDVRSSAGSVSATSLSNVDTPVLLDNIPALNISRCLFSDGVAFTATASPSLTMSNSQFISSVIRLFGTLIKSTIINSRVSDTSLLQLSYGTLNANGMVVVGHGRIEIVAAGGSINSTITITDTTFSSWATLTADATIGSLLFYRSKFDSDSSMNFTGLVGARSVEVNRCTLSTSGRLLVINSADVRFLYSSADTGASLRVQDASAYQAIYRQVTASNGSNVYIQNGTSTGTAEIRDANIAANAVMRLTPSGASVLANRPMVLQGSTFNLTLTGSRGELYLRGFQTVTVTDPATGTTWP